MGNQFYVFSDDDFTRWINYVYVFQFYSTEINQIQKHIALLF